MAASSFARSEDVIPIIATSELSGSITDFSNGQPLTAFVEVRQGFNPVVNARVTAIIERPPDDLGNDYPSVEMQLFDNGAGNTYNIQIYNIQNTYNPSSLKDYM